MPVFRLVNIFRTGAQDGNMILGQPERQVVRNLAAHGNDNPMRTLQLVDVHDPLESQFIEIQAVAHVIVRGDRFGVVIDQDTPVSLLADRLDASDGTPVEFDGTSNAVRTGP